MPRKLTRQQAMVEVIDALCPVGPWLTYDDATKLAAVCEAVAALYERGGSMQNQGLGFAVKPASLKEVFLAAARAPSNQGA
jgi:hypothetical protein